MFLSLTFSATNFFDNFVNSRTVFWPLLTLFDKALCLPYFGIKLLSLGFWRVYFIAQSDAKPEPRDFDPRDISLRFFIFPDGLSFATID